MIIAVVLIGLFAGLWHFLEEKQIELKKEETIKLKDLNSLRSQVTFLQQQVRLYQQYGEKYKDLVRKGIVKAQDRVFWADSLIQMQKTLVIPEFSFQFTPEQELDSRRFQSIKIDRGIFYFSRLNIKMSLQHDGDLPKLLNAINERVSPFYLVDNCSYEMKEKSEVVKAKFDPKEGNIETKCSLIVFHSHSKIDKNL
ncbi:hypothetical protein QCB45_06340 [Thiomicrorhabdus sp. ZW0627]|uniref:hypothetical protein n=1 Tax=Thiomicrorhabdus sp. ZW0627 TaxID=3039774 RepID=UPI0024366D82|nr:hypothetical protein [Thiomicrorhabdus sp. ZW0627]MDG6773943.1 hypothetical protein [Thiomicrorhabdus sp. ZW0627]